ncbi:hypothetical protein PIB30_067156 [Stylosanthes scabra]|uniref:Uncharacterized protein n=1 Tax=Stylosanthes scabra TaxID=79078 RepID=A0ABU6QNK2_9FABA|nr:hypothetical protein [Stylosanthes scabra]
MPMFKCGEVERSITTESMERNRYIQIQQEVHQQALPPPPQVQQQHAQQGQPLHQEFNWQDLNQQFQGMRVDQSQFYQNFQDQQNQVFQEFRNQQAQYKQELRDLGVQQHHYHQEL